MIVCKKEFVGEIVDVLNSIFILIVVVLVFFNWLISSVICLWFGLLMFMSSKFWVWSGCCWEELFR